jgi:hypothetical protein
MNKMITAFLLLFSFVCLGADTNLDRGLFGGFNNSLNNTKPYAYKISKDLTAQAPTKNIEIFELRHGDCFKDKTWNDCINDRERMELKQKNTSLIDHQTHWYGWSFYIPENYQDVSPVKLSIAQFYDEGAAEPVWMFQLNEDGLYIDNQFNKAGLVKLLVKKSDLVKKWHTIQLEMISSRKSDGKLNIWVDGAQVFTYNGATFKSNEFYFKYGLYRSFLSRWKNQTKIPTQIIYFSNVKMTKTQKDLLPKN